MKRIRSYRSRKKVLSAFVMTAALVAASCGGSTTDAGGSNDGTSSSGEGSGQGTGSDDGANASKSFPSTEVLSLAEGKQISFTETVADVDTPILLWFYLPH